MTIDETLSRLRAGLDEDERIARAAAERSGEWTEIDNVVYGGEITPDDEAGPGMIGTGEHIIVHDEGEPTKAEAQHIARHDPARVLPQAGALRKVLAVCDAIDADALDGGWREGKYSAHADAIREALAEIYAEDGESAE